MKNLIFCILTVCFGLLVLPDQVEGQTHFSTVIYQDTVTADTLSLDLPKDFNRPGVLVVQVDTVNTNDTGTTTSTSSHLYGRASNDAQFVISDTLTVGGQEVTKWYNRQGQVIFRKAGTRPHIVTVSAAWFPNAELPPD